jgi:hypothetical protein
MKAASVTQPPADQQRWPRRTELPLAALPTAPGVARGHVRSVAREWGLAGLANTAELVVSELVTNAVQASARLQTAGPPVVVLWITSDGISLVTHVWDASPEMPVSAESGGYASRGFYEGCDQVLTTSGRFAAKYDAIAGERAKGLQVSQEFGEPKMKVVVGYVRGAWHIEVHLPERGD